MKSIIKSINSVAMIILVLFSCSAILLSTTGSQSKPGSDKTETGGAFLENATTGATTDTINNNTSADSSYEVVNTGRYKTIYFTYRQNSKSTYAKVLWDEPTKLRCKFSPAASGDTGYVIEKPGPGGIGWTRVPVLLPTVTSGANGVATNQPAPVEKIWLTVGATPGIISWFGRNNE